MTGDETSETPESLSFKKIFGHRGKKGAKSYSGDVNKAETVLDDILAKFPAYESDKTKSTKSKISDVRLTSYMETKGTTVSDNLRLLSLRAFRCGLVEVLREVVG